MIRDFRIKKLKQIKEPYPAKTTMPYHGRIKSIREHGGSIFAHIDNQQIYLKRDILKNKFEEFKNIFDIGDIIEVSGKFFKTKTGEKTIQVKNFKMLAKSLRPLPEKWHGLQDKEIRFRKRYLDLLMNPEVRKIFETRSEIIKKIRAFLDKNNFIEVETPILQTIPGGTLARPFKTHLNALDLNLYLRIAPELYLKRLLVGGFDRVYEIGRCFRNEGMDKNHNPDFTMLEFYAAYWDYEKLMDFTEKLMAQFGFPKKWERVKYISDEAFAKIKKPTFVWGHPVEISPLAKKIDSKRAARFQGIVNGIEIINAYSELNNPIEQLKRFKEQEQKYKKGDKEAHRMDKDFVEALEYAMPPAAGFGMGIDRLTMLLTGSKTLREVILFPTMRPKKNKNYA
ncbi:MAG: amino acid--tRNA ligase-related protein [bacterium]